MCLLQLTEDGRSGRHGRIANVLVRISCRDKNVQGPAPARRRATVDCIVSVRMFTGLRNVCRALQVSLGYVTFD